VGGLCANTNYAIHGKSDPVYVNDNNAIAFSTKIKTMQSWSLGNVWYRNSRGFQSLGLLYGTNHPVVLLNQKQFVILFLHHQNNELYIFPTPANRNANGEVFSEEFATAIAYCLLKSSLAIRKKK